MLSISRRESTSPISFFFLTVPVGISGGFISVTLPFILTQAGFSVATAGYIVAIGASAYVFRWVWGPIIDFTLTPRLWYVIGLFSTAGMVFLLGIIPLHLANTKLLFTAVFVSQLATTLIMLPLGSFMAHTVSEGEKGRAAGWYEAGNVAGAGISITGGIWLAAHHSKEVAAGGVSAAILVCLVAVFLVSEVHALPAETLRQGMSFLGKDLRSVLSSKASLFIVVLVCLPIGTGAMTHQWGGVWRDWHTTPDLVALFTGILSGLISALGCVLAGWVADQFGRWRAYFGSGIVIAIVAVSMALAPRTAEAFSTGVLAYSLMFGATQAAFSALVLFAIGKGAASTKYALLCSLGNVPIAYMTALDGWVHDKYGSAWMLHFDGLSGLFFIVI
ncbi:MAG TPA: MFS transporter, partial [Candidatus Binataceae bacterium]|nr:MFS transporter [Candidatus Binataceae bacterium]